MVDLSRIKVELLLEQSELLKENNRIRKEQLLPDLTLHDKFRIIDALKNEHKIDLMCRVLEVNRSSYYQWLNK